MKKTLSLFILLLTILIVFTSCNKQESISHSELEQQVFYEISPSLLDSIHFDRRLLPPQPPPPIKDKNGNTTQLDSTQFKKAMRSWEKRKEKVSNDTTLTYIMVQDSILFNDNFVELIDHFQNDKLIPDTLYSGENYKIDLAKLKANSTNIKFKYLSENPKNKAFWKTKSEFYIAASMSFTRIQFDKSKSFGVLNASHSIGMLNGFGVIVFIKKDKYGNWIIDKISGTWIS